MFGSLLGVLASLGLWKKCYFPPIYWTPKQPNRDKYLWAISKALSLPRLHFPILLFTCSVPIPIPNSIHETHPRDYGSNYAPVSHFLFSLSYCMESKWYHNFELQFFFQFWGSMFWASIVCLVIDCSVSTYYYILPYKEVLWAYSTNEEREAQRSYATCSRSHNSRSWVTGLGFNSKHFGPLSWIFDLYYSSSTSCWKERKQLIFVSQRCFQDWIIFRYPG